MAKSLLLERKRDEAGTTVHTFGEGVLKVRWPRELNALQLEKTHAETQKCLSFRKQLHRYDTHTLRQLATPAKYTNALLPWTPLIY